ncbi:MAG TPA: radical SAM protein [Pirellulales bacterium]|nr:radical SAM protein [Pirellulales bacterium]
MTKRTIILVQLPIPPVGPEPIRGNVPLAAGYMKMFARQCGLEAHYDIDLLPTIEANALGDQALVEAILARRPWMVGFTCYLWNIERTLWIAQQIKQREPSVQILIGGPEVTLDNAWVIQHPAVDYAAIGEGEQTFADLLAALVEHDEPAKTIPGLICTSVLNRKQGAGAAAKNGNHPHSPFPTPHSPFPFLPRPPLPHLNNISSPYLAGILDAADERMLLLETIRGCIFKCKFCYYPKSYDDLYFVSKEKIVANLEHARRRGAKEVVLLDPTLNQRRNFPDFLRLLARCNPGRGFTYFGELRAEGITPQVAALLHEAGFTEVEIGLQSIDPLAMELMDRHNNLRSFERGARAMLDLGIKVKVDLIIGLPGDTVDSVRRGIEYIRTTGLYSQVQVFNLAVLPGTSFRQEAEALGLIYQNRPPYYVLQTPTLSTQQMYDLMAEAEDAFETEFDPLPEPALHKAATVGRAAFGKIDFCHTNLDEHTSSPDHPYTCSHPHLRTQVFTLWLQSADFHAQRQRAAQIVQQILSDNPFTTLQIVLEPTGDLAELPETLTTCCCDAILRAALKQPTYLDRFYSVQPGRMKGAKRLIVVLPAELQEALGTEHSRWLDEISAFATLVWRDQQMAETISIAAAQQR